MYCSPTCKQLAWALRDARARLDADSDPTPTVVHDVIERTLRPKPAAPDWIALLGLLCEQLGDDTTALAREHWHHRRLFTALQNAAAALDTAHPAALDTAHPGGLAPRTAR
jgi:hypothetical protein